MADDEDMFFWKACVCVCVRERERESEREREKEKERDYTASHPRRHL